jgi:chromosome segregation ATPase
MVKSFFVDEQIVTYKAEIKSLEGLMKESDEHARKESEETISRLIGENESMMSQVSALEEEIGELDAEKAELSTRTVTAEDRCNELESVLESKKLELSEMVSLMCNISLIRSLLLICFLTLIV